MTNLLQEDLDRVLTQTQGLWEPLRGQNIFITGGTGFFGCWLLETFAWANRQLQLGARATVLSRNPQAFAAKAPHLADDEAIEFHQGDVRDFTFPAGCFPFIIHAAADAGAFLAQSPMVMADTIIQGTRRVLDFAVGCGARRLLLTSSGAVYGRQRPEMTHVDESYAGAPDVTDLASTYGECKRLAELMCCAYSRQHGLDALIARCFAFVGPYLPLDAHYAAGNFIRDALAGGPIVVKGDGAPLRSYLYAADLAEWLWAILFRGRTNRPYNVGSDQAITIAALAEAVASCAPARQKVIVAERPAPGAPASRYVPATARARSELNLPPPLPLEQALRKTLAWYSQTGHGRSSSQPAR